MNWVTIIGLFIVAIGTGLIIYGTSIMNKQDLKKEITSFSQKIKKVESEAKTEDTKEKVKQIEEEFESWAKDFTDKKNIKQLEFEKDILNVKDRTAKLNLQYRELYHYFFDTLRSYVIAYNHQNPKNKLIYEINNFPNDIFSSESEKYVAKVEFSKTIVHKYVLRVIQPIDADKIPGIVLLIDDNFDRPLAEFSRFILEETSISFIFVQKHEFVYIEKKNEKLIIPQLKEQYSMKDYKASLNEIIRKIMEGQLISLKG